MKTVLKNIFWIFIGVILALFSIPTQEWNLRYSFDSLGTECQNSENTPCDSAWDELHVPVAAAILDSRQGVPQVFSRFYGGTNPPDFFNRSPSLHKNAEVPERISSTFAYYYSGFPSSLLFTSPKDYYVYTLERMLC